MLKLGDDSNDAHVEIGRLAAELGFMHVVVVGRVPRHRRRGR